MTITERAFRHNPSAFLAELHEAVAARRLHNDYIGATQLETTIIRLGAGEVVETDWTRAIARRFIHAS